MSDRTVKFRVAVEVSVKEIKFHTTYIYAPYVAVNDTTGIRNFKNHRLTILIENLLDGELLEILSLIICYLLTIDRKTLREVAIAI